jgi:hypothetical protein
LVVTLDPALGELARDAIASDPRVTLGEPQGCGLPVVTETETLSAGEDLVREIGRIPGVLNVDVVEIDFSDLEGESA